MKLDEQVVLGEPRTIRAVGCQASGEPRTIRVVGCRAVGCRANVGRVWDMIVTENEDSMKPDVQVASGCYRVS